MMEYWRTSRVGPRLLMDTSAILRKVLLMHILQKQNKTDRMRNISVAFCL